MDLIEGNATAPRRHPWESARFWFFSRALRSVLRGGARVRVLDVGAGDAWFGQRLCERWPLSMDLVGLDPNYPETLLGERGGVTLVRELPQAERFQGLLMLDVLEHVEDDLALLRTSTDHLDPGGWLLVSVPAWPSLYTSHDRALQHVRRYTRRALHKRLQQAELDILRSGGLFPSLLPLRWAAKMKENALGAAPFTGAAWDGGPWTTGLLHGLLVVDAWLCGVAAQCRIPLPGLSWWALCRKP